AAALSGRFLDRGGRLRSPAPRHHAARHRARRHRDHRGRAAGRGDAARSRAGSRRSGLMAQLTDDCFAFSGPLLPIDEVERILRERLIPVAETETVPLGAAYGRVLASDVTAPISLPPFDNSAVDGYAVRAADLDPTTETRLAIMGRVTAGSAAARSLAPGA